MSRKIFLVIFFALQVFGIIYARFTDVRYFCWAPYDQISIYQIEVRLSHGLLTNEEIESRYHIPVKSRENRSIQNIISLIKQYEQSYGKHENASVKLIYNTNGKPAEIWRYP